MQTELSTMIAERFITHERTTFVLVDCACCPACNMTTWVTELQALELGLLVREYSAR